MSFSSHAALNAVTAQVIHGRAPAISFDNGVTKASSLSGLLSVEYPAGTTITSTTSTITVKPTDTFADVITKVTADAGVKNLSDLGQYIDDDGDVASGTGVTGTIKATWSYVNAVGTTVKLGSADLSSNFSACNAPYNLTIEVNGAGAESAYGSPKTSTLGSTNHTYTVNLPAGLAAICFAQPNLDYSFSGYNPAVWDPTKGFLLQSGNPALNFPTTGFDGAWFNLVVGGIDAMAVGGWEVTYPSGKTNVTAKAEATSSTTVKVDISGPNETTALRSNNKLDFTPTHIKITDKGGNNVSYEFKINRWFIPKYGDGNGYANAKPFCDSLGSAAGKYIVPIRADYSNNPYANPVKYPRYPATNGTNPVGGTYTRAIGQGVFSEWGYTRNTYYKASSWEYKRYWASEAWNASPRYSVHSNDGSIYANSRDNTGLRIACRAL